MAEVSRLRKKQSANRNVVDGLITKAKVAMDQGHTPDVVLQVAAYFKTIKTKEKVLAEINDSICEVVEEEKIDETIEDAVAFEERIGADLSRIENFVMQEKMVGDGDKVGYRRSMHSPTYESARGSPKVSVKLPKLIIKKFTGDATAWQQFNETFSATVDCNDSLSDVEKFSYLKGLLGGEAEKCVEGISLTGDNYKEALGLLKERFGNSQLIVASHMSKLLKLEKVKVGRNVKELRNLFDQLESHVRSLSTIGVESQHYGPLLIPIVLERLPDDIKLEISRQLGKVNWKMDEFMAKLKEEITARESCLFMKSQVGGEMGDAESRHLTTGALLTNTKVLVCAFCHKNHFHDKCSVVTDIKERKEIVRRNRLCYRCLLKAHSIRTVEVKEVATNVNRPIITRRFV